MRRENPLFERGLKQKETSKVADNNRERVVELINIPHAAPI